MNLLYNVNHVIQIIMGEVIDKIKEKMDKKEEIVDEIKEKMDKQDEDSRNESASVTEQYTPHKEQQDRIEKTNLENSQSTKGIVDWDSIIHKNVRAKDREAVGSIAAVKENSIIITSAGARDEYNIPKEEVQSFNGAEVILNTSFDKLDQFKVHVAR